MSQLPLDAIFVCRHDERDECACRKPKPGLIHMASKQLQLDPDSSYLIGDRWRDIDAGAAANCRTILIDRGYSERDGTAKPDATVLTIMAAGAWIVAREADPSRTLS